MSSALDELRKLIGGKSTASVGTVITDSGGFSAVATPDGIKELPNTGRTAYTQGDTVRIFNGVIVGKVSDDSSLPIYYV